MTRRSIVLTAALAIGALAFGERSVAQFGDVNPSYSQEVLIENGKSLSSEIIDVVARTLSRRALLSLAQESDFGLTSISLVPTGANVGDDAQIFTLVIQYQGMQDNFDEKRLHELWEKTRGQMETALRQVQRTATDRRRRELDEQLAWLRGRKDQYLGELHDALQLLDKFESGSSGTAEQIQRQLAEAASQLWKVQLDGISNEARRKAIEERIDYLRQVAAKTVDEDPMMAELEKIVVIREQQSAIAKQLGAAGQASDDEERQADAAVAQARIELLKAKRTAATDANGAVLAALNDELSKLFVEDAELKAKAKVLKALVAQLRKESSTGARMELAGAAAAVRRLQDRVDETEQALAELESRRGGGESEISIRSLDEALPAADAEESK